MPLGFVALQVNKGAGNKKAKAQHGVRLSTKI